MTKNFNTDIKSLTCTILDYTKKGYKIEEHHASIGRTKAKNKIAYYYSIEFDAEKGLWEEIEEKNTFKELPVKTLKTGCIWDILEDYYGLGKK